MTSSDPLIGTSTPRIVLNLGKYRVLDRDPLSMKLALGGSTTMTVALSRYMDVKAGDLLTLYTEVYLVKPEGTS